MILFPSSELHVCFPLHTMTPSLRAEAICMRRERKVLVRWAIVRNEEFQQFRPAEGERRKNG